MNKLQQILHRKRLAYLRTFCDAAGKPHPEAQRVIADLKKFCRLTRGGLVVSPVMRMSDPYATAYQAGLRDACLRILHMINVDEVQSNEGDTNADS